MLPRLLRIFPLPRASDIALGFLLLVITTYIPCMIYDDKLIPAYRPKLHDPQPNWFMKRWGGPPQSGVTAIRLEGNWFVDMPPRRLNGVRDNRVAALDPPSRLHTTMFNQTIVTPPYWSVTASPPSKAILQTHGVNAFGYEVAAGWPFIALHGAIIGQPPAKPTRRWAIELPIPSAYNDPGSLITNGRILPLRPIFPGFILNLLFWTLLCTGIRAAINNLRSRRNQARGHCPNPACGYPLHTLHTCPECGTPAQHLPNP